MGTATWFREERSPCREQRACGAQQGLGAGGGEQAGAAGRSNVEMRLCPENRELLRLRSGGVLFPENDPFGAQVPKRNKTAQHHSVGLHSFPRPRGGKEQSPPTAGPEAMAASPLALRAGGGPCIGSLALSLPPPPTQPQVGSRLLLQPPGSQNHLASHCPSLSLCPLGGWSGGVHSRSLGCQVRS